VLSLKGYWLDGRVTRRGCFLAFEPAKSFVGGMSGSSIVSPEGQAIGVVSVDLLSPVLTDTLPPRLLRRIVAPRKARKRKLPARFDVSSERTFGLSWFCTLRILARRNRKLPDFRPLIAQRYQFTVLARLPLLHLVERFPSCDDDTPARLVT
jgi:hypothetical protein